MDQLIRKCRFCHNEDYVGNMIIPCNCKQYKYVHRGCLDSQRSIDDINFSRCEICSTEYNLIPDPEDEAQLNLRTYNYRMALLEDAIFITILILSVIILIIVMIIFIDMRSNNYYFNTFGGLTRGNWYLFYILAGLFFIFIIIGFITLIPYMIFIFDFRKISKSEISALAVLFLLTGITFSFMFAYQKVVTHIRERRAKIIRKFEVNRLYVKDLTPEYKERDLISSEISNLFENSIPSVNNIIAEYLIF